MIRVGILGVFLAAACTSSDPPSDPEVSTPIEPSASEAGPRPKPPPSETSTRPPSPVEALWVTGTYSCARLTDENVWCWGSRPRLLTPPPSASTPFRRFWAQHYPRLRAMVGEDCRGRIHHLAAGTASTSARPLDLMPATQFAPAGCGCALDPAGGVRCIVRSPDTPSSSAQQDRLEAVSGLRAARILVGQPTGPIPTPGGTLGGTPRGYGCALVQGGTVACWGDNAWGHLGDGTTTSRHHAQPVPSLTGVTDIAAGRVVCALRDDGSLWCWGQWYDEASDEHRGSVRPVRVEAIEKVRDIALAEDLSCLLFGSGDVRCWRGAFPSSAARGSGRTVHGLGSRVAELAQVHEVEGMNPVRHMCATLVDGEIACWGDNTFGALGNGESGTPEPDPPRASVVRWHVGAP